MKLYEYGWEIPCFFCLWAAKVKPPVFFPSWEAGR